MAASFAVPSALSASPPGVFLPQLNPAVLPLSNLVFFSRCRTLSAPSLIERQINNRRSRLRHQPVVRAGQPSTSTLILVFALPLSLLIGTIAVSLRIGHQLDEKFLEELALHQALMEENEDEEGDERMWVSDGRAGEEERVPVKEEVGSVRIRNRPKREV